MVRCLGAFGAAFVSIRRFSAHDYHRVVLNKVHGQHDKTEIRGAGPWA